MTSTTDILEDILKELQIANYSGDDKEKTIRKDSSYIQSRQEAKQQILSHLKEVITKAKPEYRDNTDSGLNLPEYDDFISVEHNQAIDQYHKNLLRELGIKQ